MNDKLKPEEKKTLLMIARDAITAHVNGQKPKQLDEYPLSPALLADGASFVTLTKKGKLRGCIGTLQAVQSLAEDVQLRAIQAATEDPRFPAVQASELAQIKIEISHLTPPVKLDYENPQDLAQLIRPHQDGVILKDGFRRATFLPQVWDQLPYPEDFLSHLCQKMGVPGGYWKKKLLEVSIYSVEDFSE